MGLFQRKSKKEPVKTESVSNPIMDYGELEKLERNVGAKAKNEKIAQYKSTLPEILGFEIKNGKPYILNNDFDYSFAFCVRNFKDENNKTVNADIFSGTEQRFLIVGKAGCGKSTFLKSLAATDTEIEDVIPIFLELKGIPDSKPFEEYLGQDILNIDIDSLPANSKIHLYLDAADEVPLDKKDEIFGRVKTFLQKHNIDRTVVTTRNVSDLQFANNKLIAGYQYLAISAFSNNETENFIYSNIQNEQQRNRFISAISDYDEEIKNTPFYLTELLIGFLNKSEKGIPKTLAGVMDQMIERLFGRERNKQISHRTNTLINSAELKLPKFAYQNVLADIESVQISKVLDNFETEVLVSRSILNKYGDDFAVQKVKEFFAAKYIVSNEDLYGNLSGIFNQNPEKWENVLNYIVSIWENGNLPVEIFKDVDKDILIISAKSVVNPQKKTELYSYIVGNLIDNMMESSNKYATDFFYYLPKYKLYRYAVNKVLNYTNRDDKEFLSVASLVRDLCFTYGNLDFAEQTGAENINKILNRIREIQIIGIRMTLCRLFYSNEEYADDYVSVYTKGDKSDYVYPREFSPIHAVNRVRTKSGKSEIDYYYSDPEEFCDQLGLYKPSDFGQTEYRGLCFISYDKQKIEESFRKDDCDTSHLSGIILLPRYLDENDKRIVTYKILPPVFKEIRHGHKKTLEESVYPELELGISGGVIPNCVLDKGLLRLDGDLEEGDLAENKLPEMLNYTTCYATGVYPYETKPFKNFKPERIRSIHSLKAPNNPYVLEKIDINMSRLYYYSIPHNILGIKEYAYNYMHNISYIFIPRWVNHIAPRSFFGVLNLTIYFEKRPMEYIPFTYFTAGDKNFVYNSKALSRYNFAKQYYPEIENAKNNKDFINCIRAILKTEVPNNRNTVSVSEKRYFDMNAVLCSYELNGKQEIDISSLGRALWYNTLLEILFIKSANHPACFLQNSLDEGIVSLNIMGEGVNIIEGLGGFSSLKKVELPARLFYIKNSCFDNDTALEEVVLNSKPLEIGDKAFKDCKKLKNINIDACETLVKEWAFENCDGIKNIYPQFYSQRQFFESDFDDDCMLEKPHPSNNNFFGGVKVYTDKEIDEIERRFIENIKDKTEITQINTEIFGEYGRGLRERVTLKNHPLPNSIKKIEYGAFDAFVSLDLKSLPDDLEIIEGDAFNFCKSLALKSLPPKLKMIGFSAFENCHSLALEHLPQEIIRIEKSAFKNCYQLNLGALPPHIKKIQPNTFENCSNLNFAAIPEGVTEIGDSAFAGCKNLALQTLPNSLESLGTKAFMDCYALRIKELPPKIEYICPRTFERCANLELTELNAVIGFPPKKSFSIHTLMKTPDIPNAAFAFCEKLKITTAKFDKSIGKNVFFNCGSLETFEVPDNVTQIETLAFAACTSLNRLILHDHLNHIGKNAFYGCKNLFAENSDGILIKCKSDEECDDIVENKIIPYFTQIFGFNWEKEYRQKFSRFVD